MMSAERKPSAGSNGGPTTRVGIVAIGVGVPVAVGEGAGVKTAAGAGLRRSLSGSMSSTAVTSPIPTAPATRNSRMASSRIESAYRSGREG